MRLIWRLICVAMLAAAIWLTPHGARAALTGACTVPDYLLSSDYRLRRVTAAVEKQKALRIAVVGTGSSALPGRTARVGLPGAAGSRTQRPLAGCGYQGRDAGHAPG